MKLNNYSWLALLPLAFTACQDDMLVENAKQPSEERFTLKASMPGNDMGSRAQIVIGGTSTERETFYWNENDAFAMYTNTDEYSRFVISEDYQEETQAKIADFTTGNTPNYGASFVAFYPDCENEQGRNAWQYDWNGSYRAVLDNTFTVEDGDVDAAWRKFFNRNMLMTATGNVGVYSTDESVAFQHLCGLIRITFTDATTYGSTLHSIRLDGSWGNEVYVSRETGEVVASDENNYMQELLFEHPTGFTVPQGESQDFYMFFLPPTGENVNPLTQISIACHLNHALEPIAWETTPATYNGEEFAVSGFEAGKCYWFNVTRTDQGLVWTKHHTSSDIEKQPMVEITEDAYIFKNKAFASLLVEQAGYKGFELTEEGYASISKSLANEMTDLYIGGSDETFVGHLDEELAYFPNLTELSLNKIGLLSADFSALTSLVKLECTLNSLTKLDVSANVELEELICGRNQLTSLDLSKNTKLKIFRSRANEGASWIYNNYFSEIDFSNNTALVEVDLDWNCLIEDIDISMLPQLEVLSVGGLPLTSLDLSKNVNLKSLSCGSTDKLSSIDFSNNLLLEYLAMEWTNKVVDLSELPNLKKFYYYTDNNVALDFSACTNLEELCYSTPAITSFDASHMTKLMKLNVSNCHNLVELTLGTLPSLSILECSSNKLSTLDLSGCTRLGTLRCYDNQLTTLDITPLTNLYSEDWNVEIGNQKDKSGEYTEEFLELTLTLTSIQNLTWESSWGSNGNNGHVILNVVGPNVEYTDGGNANGSNFGDGGEF